MPHKGRLYNVYLLLATIGCCGQVIHVSLPFFRYTTSTQVVGSFRKRSPVPVLSFCMRTADVLDYEAIAAETGIKAWAINDSHHSLTRILAEPLTVRQVMKYLQVAGS